MQCTCSPPRYDGDDGWNRECPAHGVWDMGGHPNMLRRQLSRWRDRWRGFWHPCVGCHRRGCDGGCGLW
jgi:hypothetical protein